MVMCPKSEFTHEQLNRLNKLGDVIYTESRDEYPLEQLIEMSKDCTVLAFSPENIGGFDVAQERLIKLMDEMPNIKGVALETTSFGYLNLDYCKSRNIFATNAPHYSTESVAEHTLTFLLGLSKRIFISDRKTQLGEFTLVQGFELKGKTLGILGLGHIGSRVAELGQAIGMRVIAWNRSPKNILGVEMKSIDEVLTESDAISIHLARNQETKGFLSEARIAQLKKGTIVVSTVGLMVDEQALVKALQTGQVDSCALEVSDVFSSPLANIENAFLFKGFGWFTKEALERNKEIWIDNIEGIIKSTPVDSLL